MFFNRKGQFGETNEEEIIFDYFLKGSFQDFSQFIFPAELDDSSDLIRDLLNSKTLLIFSY